MICRGPPVCQSLASWSWRVARHRLPHQPCPRNESTGGAGVGGAQSAVQGSSCKHMLPCRLCLTHSGAWHVSPRQGLSSEPRLLGLELKRAHGGGGCWCSENRFPPVPGISAFLFPGFPILRDLTQVKTDGHSPRLLRPPPQNLTCTFRLGSFLNWGSRPHQRFPKHKIQFPRAQL